MSALRVDDAIKEDGSRQDIEERRDGQIVAQGQPDEVGAAWPRAGPDGHAVQPAAIDVRQAYYRTAAEALLLREFCGKSDAAFGGLWVFRWVRAAKACHSGECA